MKSFNTFRKTATLFFGLTLAVSAQSNAEPDKPRASLAVEADALAYFLKGYSGILRLTLANGFNVAFGSGRYNVPGFILEGDANYDRAGWKATAESIQVLRVGYRFGGAMKNGLAVDAIAINQNWRLRAEKLGSEARFRPLGVGLSAGYYIHIGKHFYIYPTASFTYNTVYSGSASVSGAAFQVRKYQPNGSVHVGWEWGI